MPLDWGAPVAGIRVGAEVVPRSARRGQRRELTIGVENLGAATRDLARTAPLADFDVNVTDSRGGAVPLTPAGQQQTVGAVEDAIFRLVYVALAPGAVREDRLDLTALFDLDGPDQYELTVRVDVDGVVASTPTIPFSVT